VERIGHSFNRLSLAIIIAALLIAVSSIIPLYHNVKIFGLSLPGIGLGSLVVLTAVWIISIMRSGKF
jgi:hypothetical protein